MATVCWECGRREEDSATTHAVKLNDDGTVEPAFRPEPSDELVERLARMAHDVRWGDDADWTSCNQERWRKVAHAFLRELGRPDKLAELIDRSGFADFYPKKEE